MQAASHPSAAASQLHMQQHRIPERAPERERGTHASGSSCLGLQSAQESVGRHRCRNRVLSRFSLSFSLSRFLPPILPPRPPATPEPREGGAWRTDTAYAPTVL
eukprot:2031547-Rhodomonas_salina.1